MAVVHALDQMVSNGGGQPRPISRSAACSAFLSPLITHPALLTKDETA